MQIFVLNLQGKTITIDVDPEDTILDVKNLFLKKEKIVDDPTNFKFIYAGKLLDNSRTLEEFFFKLKESKSKVKVVSGDVGYKNPQMYKRLIIGLINNELFTMFKTDKGLNILDEKKLGDLGWIEYRDLKKGSDAFKEIHNGTCVAPKIILLP